MRKWCTKWCTKSERIIKLSNKSSKRLSSMNMIISYFYGDVLLVELINMEVKFTMDITKEILRRATIQGITEYLLYGSAIEAKQTEPDYNKKLEESYSKNEDVLREHESKTFSELVDSANEMASDVSEVYTALGLQAGMKIMQELLKGMNR